MIFRKFAKKILSKSPKLYTSVHTKNFERTHHQDFSQLNDEEKKILLTVKNDGYIVINDFFDKDFCMSCMKDMDKMFEDKKEFLHEDNFGDSRIYGAEELSENMNKFYEHPLLNRLAAIYSGVSTVCGFTLAGRIKAGSTDYGSGGPWHRDSYFRQFKSLLYLTDVDENNGPFQVIRDSHKPEQISKDSKTGNLESIQCTFSHEIIEKIIKNDLDRLKTLTGKAGTVVLVDTSAMHRGLPLNQGTRYALTNYFFEKSQINEHLVEHFSPLVAPNKVLELGVA